MTPTPILAIAEDVLKAIRERDENGSGLRAVADRANLLDHIDYLTAALGAAPEIQDGEVWANFYDRYEAWRDSTRTTIPAEGDAHG